MRLVVVASAVVGLLASMAGTSSAAIVHNYLSSFGSFTGVQSIAVDQATGDVYVYDASAEAIFKFDAAGKPLEFSATGSNEISGIPGAGNAEGEIAVDSSSGPAKGDIYVAHASGEGLLIYDASGKEIGELDEASGVPWGEACGVTVDPAGNVYVGLYSYYGEINKYVPSTNPVTSSDYTASVTGVYKPCNVATGSSADVFVASWSEGPIARYEASQFGSLSPQGANVDVLGSTLAVDPATDEVYVDEGDAIAQFGSHGEPFERPISSFASSGEGAIGGSYGVAVDGGSGEVYASNGSGGISVFGPNLIVPSVSTGAATNVQATSATISGAVNPSGVALTECVFEYGETTTYEHSAPCAESLASIGEGDEYVEVRADLTGLSQEVTYHYRLVAENAEGTSGGLDQSFVTPGPPIVTQTSLSGIAYTEAQVSAAIDPNNASTTYHVEYGTSKAYGSSTPESSPVGSDAEAHQVTAQLSGLQSGDTYHFRFVASNSVDVTYGPDETLRTYAQSIAGGECANEERRREQDATWLPDCRAYEMVSPLDKNGSDVFGAGTTVLGAATGDRASFFAPVGFGETTGSGIGGLTQYVAVREANAGWTTHGITPTPERESLQYLAGVTVSPLFSEDMTHAVTEGVGLPAGGPTAIQGGENVYVENTATGALQPITTPLGEPITQIGSFSQTGPGIKATSGDLGVVTYETRLNLLTEAEGSEPKLYAWEHGALKLAGVLPNGSLPASGSTAPFPGSFDTEENQARGAVSRDGSRIAFMAEGQLYLRREGTSTAWVSQSEASAPNHEPQSVRFEEMTSDGRHVLFATTDRLLDSDPGGATYGLYLYTDSPDPESESNLTFIARVNGPEEELVAGMSEDAKRIYFYTQATSEIAETGTYLWDEGTLHAVASTTFAPARRTVETSADGRTLAFMSEEALTSANARASTYEMYVYDEEHETLTCASCLRTGAPTEAPAELAIGALEHPPTGTPNLSEQQRFLARNGGYVFFSTAEPLVGQDVNGLSDVYEYDVQTGEVDLLSTGTGEGGAWFADADENGENVFIVTAQSLLAQDTDKLIDVYDVRVGGGFPQPKPEVGSCVGDECQGTPSAPPSFNTANGFHGQGNLVPESQTTSKSKKHAGKRGTTRTQRLRRALAACARRHRQGKQLRACRARARRRFGPRSARDAGRRASKTGTNRAGLAGRR